MQAFIAGYTPSPKAPAPRKPPDVSAAAVPAAPGLGLELDGDKHEDTTSAAERSAEAASGAEPASGFFTPRDGPDAKTPRSVSFTPELVGSVREYEFTDEERSERKAHWRALRRMAWRNEDALEKEQKEEQERERAMAAVQGGATPMPEPEPEPEPKIGEDYMSAEKLAQVNAAWEDEQEDDGAEEQAAKPAQVVKMPQQDMDKLQDHHHQQQQQQQQEEEQEREAKEEQFSAAEEAASAPGLVRKLNRQMRRRQREADTQPPPQGAQQAEGRPSYNDASPVERHGAMLDTPPQANAARRSLQFRTGAPGQTVGGGVAAAAQPAAAAGVEDPEGVADCATQ